jgi:hypothetical protein
MSESPGMPFCVDPECRLLGAHRHSDGYVTNSPDRLWGKIPETRVFTEIENWTHGLTAWLSQASSYDWRIVSVTQVENASWVRIAKSDGTVITFALEDSNLP